MISSKYCAQCAKHTVHEKNDMSHLMHLVLAFFTAGLWLPVWLFCAAQHSSTAWICRNCGLPQPGFIAVTWAQLRPWVTWYNTAVVFGALAALGLLLKLLGIEPPQQ